MDLLCFDSFSVVHNFFFYFKKVKQMDLSKLKTLSAASENSKAAIVNL